MNDAAGQGAEDPGPDPNPIEPKLLTRRDVLIAVAFAIALIGVVAITSAVLHRSHKPVDCGLDVDDMARADFECRMHQARVAWCRRWASSMTLVHQCIEQSEKTMREQVGASH